MVMWTPDWFCSHHRPTTWPLQPRRRQPRLRETAQGARLKLVLGAKEDDVPLPGDCYVLQRDMAKDLRDRDAWGLTNLQRMHPGLTTLQPLRGAVGRLANHRSTTQWMGFTGFSDWTSRDLVRPAVSSGAAERSSGGGPKNAARLDPVVAIRPSKRKSCTGKVCCFKEHLNVICLEPDWFDHVLYMVSWEWEEEVDNFM